jgi:hypothetical protein
MSNTLTSQNNINAFDEYQSLNISISYKFTYISQGPKAQHKVG